MSKKAVLLLILVLIIGSGAGGIYLADRLYYGPMREQKRLIDNLKLIVDRLTKDIRIAEVKVVDQTPTKTTFKFLEIDEKGEKVGEPKTFTIDGDIAYFDALVIKFEEPFKPLNELPLRQQDLAEPLMNKSVIIFRRVFGEKQTPESGFALDTPGKAPPSYEGLAPSSGFEQALWKEFWQLANDPKLAKSRGVRAAHGQAVSMKLQKDKYYVLEQRVTGDMTIRPVVVPAVLRD